MAVRTIKLLIELLLYIFAWKFTSHDTPRLNQTPKLCTMINSSTGGMTLGHKSSANTTRLLPTCQTDFFCISQKITHFFKNILNSDQISIHVIEEKISKFVASRLQNRYILASRFHFWNLLATNLLIFRYITCIRNVKS